MILGGWVNKLSMSGVPRVGGGDPKEIIAYGLLI